MLGTLLQARFAQIIPHQFLFGYVLAGQQRRHSELRAHSHNLRRLSSRVLFTPKLNVRSGQEDMTYQYVRKCGHGLFKNGKASTSLSKVTRLSRNSRFALAGKTSHHTGKPDACVFKSLKFGYNCLKLLVLFRHSFGNV